MEYFTIILLNSLSCILLISNGLVFKKIFKFENIQENIIESGIYGIILISIITLFLNFFVKISSSISLLILFLPLIFVYKDIYFLKKKILNLSIILGIISSLIMFIDNTNRPDAGLYHLPYINIINESKIVLGVANLEFRFGHTSILQYLSSAFNNIIFSNKGILIPLANIFAFISIYLLYLIKKHKNILRIIFFLFLFNILYSMNRYSGFGNDDPAHMFLYLTVCSYILTFFNDNKDSKKNVIFFSTYAFLIKPFLILIFLMPLFLLFTNKIKLFSKVNFFCLAILSLWFLKNILVSSCILYPEPKLCFKSLPWTTFYSSVSNPERAKKTSEAYAKDWSNKKFKIDKSEYLKKFNWLSTWKNNHFEIVIIEILPQIILVIMLILIKPSSHSFHKFSNNLAWQIFFIGLISSVLWFFKFPLYRYGQGYIITFINSFFLLTLSKDFKILPINERLFNKTLISILIIVSLGILFKNLDRIYKNYQNIYLDYPWPKMNSYTNKNKKNTNIAVYSDEGLLIYYKPYPYLLCMFSKSPCTSNLNVGKIKKRNKLGYKIYYYEK